MRGNSVRVQRSLRTRVLAASAVAFLGLSAVVCLVLPRAYEAQELSGFQDRVARQAQGLAALVAYQARYDATALNGFAGWLVSDPAFAGAALLDAEGTVLARWPESAGTFAPAPAGTGALSTPAGTVSLHPLRNGDPSSPVVAVRYSNAGLIRDFENVRWLFASLFLFTSVVFFILTKYLARTILEPLQEIGRAAMSLADGEPIVQVPQTGDREIDNLGQFISKLGESRRQSRVMSNPRDLLVAQRWGRNRPRPAPDGEGAAVVDPTAPGTRPDPGGSDPVR